MKMKISFTTKRYKLKKMFLLTGSSHVIRLMRGNAGIAVVGIRGGGCEHVKERIRFYRPRRLQAITEVVVVVGGNDLSRRISITAEEKTATKKTRMELESLVGYVGLAMPQANIWTLDTLPRSSRGSAFNSQIRAIARHIQQAGPKHHHVNFVKSFTTINKRAHDCDKAQEKYPSVTTFYRGGDGTHLNYAGYEAVRRIAEWAMGGRKEKGSAFELEEAGWRVKAMVKF